MSIPLNILALFVKNENTYHGVKPESSYCFLKIKMSEDYFQNRDKITKFYRAKPSRLNAPYIA